ncbi:MAG: hypothetical protein E7523_06175 [Ruminococcaceae bacterium]|nr:hypothetical protein [Oscillospiraceae bacterium]
MAFETLRNTVYFLRENLRQRKENRKPGQRNYMKKKQVSPTADPQYRTLIEKAADKKAPFAEKTKGYYRFSREFPDRVDAEGYRINEQNDDKPLSHRGLVLLTIALPILFAVGFVLTDTALEISDAPPPEVPSIEEENISVDNQFGEVTTLPQDDFGENATDEFILPTDVPIEDIPTEDTTLFIPPPPETTTGFADAPVEDGQFGTQEDVWG